MTERRAVILFVEDEVSLLEEFATVLERRGHQVLPASRPEEALRFIREAAHIDVAVVDLKLPIRGCSEIGFQESAGGRKAGLVLGRELRRRFKRAPVVFWTDTTDRDARDEMRVFGNCRLIPKASGPEPVLDTVDEALEGFRSGKRPRTFIVHGHDEETMRSVKRYLEETLGFPEPVVLRDMPSYGRTIIEKLESHTHTVDLVFVLLTPDDRLSGSESAAEERYRSRQNVIFEMGYFLGALGRNSGRILLLYRGPIELPSDIGGMVSIDISRGIEAADSAVRQELWEWL